MGCYSYNGWTVCVSEPTKVKKIEDFDCPCCGSLWAQVTFFEWYSPIFECWYCGRHWSDGEKMGGRSEVTLAMRKPRASR